MNDMSVLHGGPVALPSLRSRTAAPEFDKSSKKFSGPSFFGQLRGSAIPCLRAVPGLFVLPAASFQ
jgi:hypothetical protein